MEYSGEFYNVESEQGREFAIGTTVINGREIQVTRIFAFQMIWMKNYWLRTMLALIAKQQNERIEMSQKSAWCFFCDRSDELEEAAINE